MADRNTPASPDAAESDYQNKFNRLSKDAAQKDVQKLKEQEAAGDSSWKTVTKKKGSRQEPKKGKFRFRGGRAGKLHHASVFAFIFGMLGIGVWYTSVFAPNIILVNVKEMYTNDLADATIALNTYYWKMMNNKINHANCGEKISIKCKLSTMSRAQKQAFEKQGFTVLGSKVIEDMRDDGVPENDLPESRYQVSAILPPAYSAVIDNIKGSGMSWLKQAINGNFDAISADISSQLGDVSKSQLSQYSQNLLDKMPIATGDMLWLYSKISDTSKAQVYNVFNPKSSFYMDARFKQRLKSKYNLTKGITTSGSTEQAVNRSFDSSVKNGGGIDMFGRPDPTSGVSLGSLSNPVTLAQLQVAARTTATAANSYVELQCAWYSLGKSVTNNAKTAKATTIARFAMQYLKAADAIKAGVAEEIPTSVLSSKLSQATFGGYGGQNATDSTMYKSIVHGDLPIPSLYGLLYYLDTFDLIAALAPAWSQIMITAAAVGTASGAPGTLAMPPANLTNSDREYCLSGETTASKTPIKANKCEEAIIASAPPGLQGAVTGAIETGRETCPPPHYDFEDQKFEGEDIMSPSLKATDLPLTTYVAGLFGVNVMAWANVMSLLFTSQTKGVAASDAIFAGTGEILGDMAMSRGMMPSNAVFMAEYLAAKESVNKDMDQIARINARQNQFDPYNKFSFLGSITHGLTPSYDSKAPLLATLSNAVSMVGSGIKKLNPSAEAFYYLQPSLKTNSPAGLPQYLLRLNCPDPEYLAIMIMADTACNVRYSFSRLELLAQPDSVLDYMTQTHTDAYQTQIEELTERLAQADIEGNQANVQRQLDQAVAASGTPFIDRITGRAMPFSEYEKFLDYCVNRQDPWGRSAMAVRREPLPDKEIERRLAERDKNGDAISTQDKGDPYQLIPAGGYASVSEGALSDQDWYTGKKCTEQSEMLKNFRAYTMMCSVDASLSGAVDCTKPDNSGGAAYSDAFYTSNDILYTSWY